MFGGSSDGDREMETRTSEFPTMVVVSYVAVFLAHNALPFRALLDEPKTGCLGDYNGYGANRNVECFVYNEDV